MKALSVVLFIASLMVVTNGAALTTGNKELQQAIDAALTNIWANLEHIPWVNQYNVGVRSQDCSTGAAYYPYPNATAGGALATILSSKTVNIGLSLSIPPLSYRDTSNNIVGYEISLYTRVFERIAAQYSVDGGITITWVSTDGQTFLAQLLSGTVDVFIGAIKPGVYATTPNPLTTAESANLGCATLTNDITLLVNNNVGSTIGLSLLGNATLKVGTYFGSSSIRNDILALYPTSTVGNTAYQANDYNTLFEWIQNGTIDIIVTYSYTINFFRASFTTPSDWSTVSLNTQVPRAYATRRDVAQAAFPSRVATNGDEQIRQAFNAFLTAYIPTSYAAAAAAAGFGPAFRDCAPNTAFYTYPVTPLLTGTLKSVIDNKAINLCYNNAASFKGFFDVVMGAFVGELSTRFAAGATININWIVDTSTPVFTNVYNHTCDAYVGAVVPGSLNIDGVLLHTSDRLYQSCTLYTDAVTIITSGSYTGDVSIAALNVASTKIGSVSTSISGRNYAKTFFTNVNFDTYIYSTQADMFAALEAGTIQAAVGSTINNAAFKATVSNPSSYRELNLYDQILYGVAFYKPASSSGTTTTSGASQTTTSTSGVSQTTSTTGSQAVSTTSTASTLTYTFAILFVVFLSFF